MSAGGEVVFLHHGLQQSRCLKRPVCVGERYSKYEQIAINHPCSKIKPKQFFFLGPRLENYHWNVIDFYARLLIYLGATYKVYLSIV